MELLVRRFEGWKYVGPPTESLCYCGQWRKFVRQCELFLPNPQEGVQGHHAVFCSEHCSKIVNGVYMNIFYINKVADFFVCLFVQNIFLFNYHNDQSLSSNFYHQGENNQFNHLLLCHDYPSLSSNIYHQGKTTMVLLFQYPN